MTDSRITVLLGAGAMCECIPINTKMLTDLVIKKEQDYLDSQSKTGINTYPALAEIEKALKSYYHEDECISFEDILHTLEMMDSYQSGCKQSTVKAFKSVFPMFTSLEQRYNEVMNHAHRAKSDLISVIVDEIAKHEIDWKEPDNYWFCNFFRAIDNVHKLDIFSLNYDTWIEQIFKDKYNDGYVPFDEEYSRFSPENLFNYQCENDTINHLHGQICFTTHHPSIRTRYIWENQYKLLKARNFNIIQKQGVYPPYGGSMRATQSGESVDSFPIITGLRKTEKITESPFDAYFHHFYQSIMRNKRLLIIGYGFGDLYINSILNQFSGIHADGKAAVISYIDKAEWVPWIYETKAISHNTKEFYYMLFREPGLDDKRIAWERPDYLDSIDGRKTIFFAGFKQSAVEHTEKILKTLD